MRTTISALLFVAASLTQLTSANASALYDLNSNFSDSTGAGPNMNPLGGALNAGFYVFGANQGLALDWSSFDATHYDITLRFRFETVGLIPTWRKILDFNGLTRDEGLYAFHDATSDQLVFVETTNARDGFETLFVGANGTFASNQLMDLRLTRDGTIKQVNAFINNQAQFSFTDALGRAIFDTATPPLANFFVDDIVTSKLESSAGRVDFINNGPVPIPAALPLLASALGFLWGQTTVSGARRPARAPLRRSSPQHARDFLRETGIAEHVIALGCRNNIVHQFRFQRRVEQRAVV